MREIKKIKRELQKINEAVFNILDYYTCPSNCHAFCCKVGPIDLTEKEFRILRNSSHEITQNSKIVIYKSGTKIHQLCNPCLFLGTDELCTVYSRRPEMCHLYPFHIRETNPPCMEIFPCAMGIKIYKDYFEYKLFRMSETKSLYIEQARVEISNFLKKVDEKLNFYYSSMEQDDKVDTIGLTFPEIVDFSNYLKDMNTVRK